MKSIKRKLNNKGGATLLLVLVGMLVATTVSVVVVTASVSSAKHVVDDRSSTQDFYVLESAAQLVRSEMEGTIVGFKVVDTNGTISQDYSKTSGTFANEMKDVFDELKAAAVGTKYASEDADEDKSNNTSFEVTYLENEDTEYEVEITVLVSFTVEKISADSAGSYLGNYDITFNFSVKDYPDQTLSMVMHGQCGYAGNESTYAFGGWTFDSISK